MVPPIGGSEHPRTEGWQGHAPRLPPERAKVVPIVSGWRRRLRLAADAAFLRRDGLSGRHLADTGARRAGDRLIRRAGAGAGGGLVHAGGGTGACHGVGARALRRSGRDCLAPSRIRGRRRLAHAVGAGSLFGRRASLRPQNNPARAALPGSGRAWLTAFGISPHRSPWNDDVSPAIVRSLLDEPGIAIGSPVGADRR